MWRRTFRLNNIQGVKLYRPNGESDESYNERNAKHTRKYEDISKALGENWRVAMVRKLAQMADEKNTRVIGELPALFGIGGLPLADKSEYARQIRQYKQTYRKVGFHEHSDGTWRSYPQ